MEAREEDCAFCQIASGQTDTEVLMSVSVDFLTRNFTGSTPPDLRRMSVFLRFGQNEELLCFRDVKPGATHHYLVITRTHIDNCKSLQRDDVQLGNAVGGRGDDCLR